MAIHIPGVRSRSRFSGGAKRSVVAILSLTAMVDMFTVLVVFLLQNYASTGEIIDLPDEVRLPSAQSVKELKPANVIVVSKDKIMLNEKFIVDSKILKTQEDWFVPGLKEGIQKLISDGEEEKKRVTFQIKQAVNQMQTETPREEETEKFRKITIQADKEVDFLTLKKVMYTATEAGIYEINFAVITKDKKKLDGTAESL